MLEIDKLFQSGIGLKIAYLIDTEALQHPEYLKEISKRYKAVSSDVELQGTKLADLVF